MPHQAQNQSRLCQAEGAGTWVQPAQEKEVTLDAVQSLASSLQGRAVVVPGS